MFAAAIVIVLGRSLIRHDPRVARCVVAHRDHRDRGIGALRRGAVGVRARQRPVPGDQRDGRGRRVRRLRAIGDPRGDAARGPPVGRLPEARGPGRSGVPRADAVLGDGDDADGVGERPHHDVPRARDPLDLVVRPRCLRQAAAHVAGSRPQVLPARLVLVGDLPLRDRAHIRRDGQHEPHEDRAVPRDAHVAARRCAARRPRPVARRVGLQGRGRAVPHVDAGRVPGCADAGDGVHGRGHEGGGVCRGAPCVRRRVRRVSRRLASGGMGARRAVVARRQHRGNRADRREADARVSVGRACGLRADRRAGRDEQGHECGAVLRVRVRRHGDGRVRGRDRRRAARRRPALDSRSTAGLPPDGPCSPQC